MRVTNLYRLAKHREHNLKFNFCFYFYSISPFLSCVMNIWFLEHFRRNNLLIVVFIISIVSFIIKNIFNSLYPSVVLLADISKCPACYGTSACNDVFDNNFKIEPFDVYTILSHLFFSKNVFYGTMGDAKIVVKKLAHDAEFETFDEMLCENIEFRQLCWKNKNNADDYDDDRHNRIDYNVDIRNAVSLNSLYSHNNGLIVCPITKHFDKIINGSLIDHFDDMANLWTVMKINPEPIILMMLSADDGWPVPKFYGACGRIIVESYDGLPLTLYYNEPWLRRAKIAIDLLEAARSFTFGSTEYAYYLTDISSDNIAIDHYDKPKFIDLENIIIVDKNVSANDQPIDWYNLHISDNEVGCENCFVFSPLDICGHQISDHNYYAICQYILQLEGNKSLIFKGFLHSIPNNISSNYPELRIMLNECAMPTIERSRIIAGNKLQKILMKIVDEIKQ